MHPHSLKASSTSMSLPLWHQLRTASPVGFKEAAGQQVLPCLSAAAVRAQRSAHSSSGALRSSTPGSALLLVPAGGKLTPSNVEKLTPMSTGSPDSWRKLLSPGLALRTGRERAGELEIWALRDVLFQSGPLQGSRSPEPRTPRERAPAPRAAGLGSIMGSSPPPSAGVCRLGSQRSEFKPHLCL